jgi:putative redox protein
MKSTAIWQKGYQSVVDNGGNHRMTIDLPETKGGENKGPTAFELCVMSLTGCINTIFTLLAEKMRIEFSALKVELYAEQGQGAPTITDVNCTLYITSSAPEEKIGKCLEQTINICPVGVLFQQAGIEIVHEIILTQE